MAAQYGEVAAWAREAGYDGVQLGSANAKLLDQFLSPFYNRRDRRVRRVARAPGARAATHPRRGGRAGRRRLPVHGEGPGRDGAARLRRARPSTRRCGCARSSRSGASTRSRRSRCRCSPTRRCRAAACPTRSGRTRAWPKRLAQRRADRRAARRHQGRRVVGRQAGAVRAGVEPRPVRRGRSAGSSIPVFAVGGIRTAAEVNAILDARRGRPGRHRPAVLRRARPRRAASSATTPTTTALCQNSNRCVPAQMLGMKGVCYNPDTRKRPTPPPPAPSPGFGHSPPETGG